MSSSSRRSFLRNGLVLGSGALISAPALKLAHAADNQTITLYSGQHIKTTERIVGAFTDATGIKVNVRKGNSIQLANQIIEEGTRSPADAFYSEESPPTAALSERDMLAQLSPDILSSVRKDYVAPDGTWVGVTARCRVTVYNKKMIDASELPDSVLDMASEKWQNKVAFVPTSGAFQQQIVAIKTLKGRDVALQWLKDLKKYGQIYNNNMAAMRAVENEEIATALVNNYYWYIVAREKGTENMNSALHYSKGKDPGALITVSSIGVLKNAKNQAAAMKLAAYMVSEEGQKVLSSTVAEWPMNPKVKTTFDLVPFEDLDPPSVNPANLGGAAEALELRREAGLA